MFQKDSGQGDIIGIIMGAVIAIFIVIVFFFIVLPELEKAIGYSIFPISIIGFILLATIIAAVILSLLKR